MLNRRCFQCQAPWWKPTQNISQSEMMCGRSFEMCARHVGRTEYGRSATAAHHLHTTVHVWAHLCGVYGVKIRYIKTLHDADSALQRCGRLRCIRRRLFGSKFVSGLSSASYTSSDTRIALSPARIITRSGEKSCRPDAVSMNDRPVCVVCKNITDRLLQPKLTAFSVMDF